MGGLPTVEECADVLYLFFFFFFVYQVMNEMFYHNAIFSKRIFHYHMKMREGVSLV